jgi:hypothetical protein
MTKQSIVRLLAGALLLAPGAAQLLAQKGSGKADGLGLGFPTMTDKTHETGDAGKTPSSGSPHMQGFWNVSASTALAKNSSLATVVTPLLPAGTTLAADAAGFVSVGEFISALHISQNLSIPFASLQAELTGKNAVSLGQAIHILDPSLSRSAVRADVRTADREAESNFDTARIDNELANNPSLAAAVQALLPAGTNLDAAAAGFVDLHQFLATANAAYDLNISFSALKAAMTGANHDSLEQAIQSVDPTLASSAVKTGARTAQQQATMDIGDARLENQLATNTKFSSLVTPLLPAGTNLQAAAAGFDNTRQFLIAVNLSADLKISFSQLKADVTGSSPMTFEQALGKLLPGAGEATINADIRTANQQTASDLQTAFGISWTGKGDLALGH